VYFNVVEHARAAGYEGECPVAESASQRMLSLPNYAGLSRGQLDRIADVFVQSLKAYRSGARRLVSITNGSVLNRPVANGPAVNTSARSSEAVAEQRVRL